MSKSDILFYELGATPQAMFYNYGGGDEGSSSGGNNDGGTSDRPVPERPEEGSNG